MNNQQTRRHYLLALSATSALGLAGCSQSDRTEPTATSASSSNLGGANFSFEYAAEQEQVTIQYNGGASVVAGNLQVRSSAGLRVQWPQLGSTVADPDAFISTGATAVLGAGILNWGEPIGDNDTIRLVHVGRDAPATLGRFTPPESSTLTSTVPPTDAPTEEPIATFTEEPTVTPTVEPDTDAPSITAFSLSNPSGQYLRTSFDSDEQLATIEVSVSGAEDTTLTTGDFGETTSDGIYTYEATYEANSDGDYTATVDEAVDESGNDGASEQSVSLPIDTTAPTISSLSITNPVDRDLTISFESTESLSTGEVRLTGAEESTLSLSDFSESVSDGTYTYEATYEANSDGDYTATLDEAADGSGNDGANGQSTTLSLASTETLFTDDFDDAEFLDQWEYEADEQTDEYEITEQESILSHNVPFSYGGEYNGNLLTQDSFDSSGTVVVSARIRTLLSDYWGFGFELDFGDNSISLKNHRWESFDRFGPFGVEGRPDEYSSDYNYYGEQTHVAKLASATTHADFEAYSMTVDLDAGELVSVERGEESWDLALDIGDTAESFRLRLAGGGGHEIEIDSITMERI